MARTKSSRLSGKAAWAIAYTGRAEGGLTQLYTRRLDQLGSTLLPDTTLLDRRRLTRARRLPSPS
ncbi:MAG TPA: hypothetical protein VGQ49_19205 [Bryobacteraceae bacterium]|nr:hypothetical protein [Bryobacteraceae bacterium]